MNDPNVLRTMRFDDYLIERGAGSDASIIAATCAAILSGKLPAFHVAEPALTGSSFREIWRYQNAKPRECDARELSAVVAELRNAALGRDARWSLLNGLRVTVAKSPPAAERQAPKRVTARQAARAAIIAAIRELGFDPLRLPRTPGKDGPKAAVQRHIGAKVKPGVFRKEWQQMRDEGELGDA